MLRDFNGHDHWHPAVAISRIEENTPSDMIGAVRDFCLTDGSRIREQLLSLSDVERTFEYCILDAPLPLMGYVAKVRLLPVTDGEQTFWEWRSTFKAPHALEKALVKLVGEDIYEAGFRAIKQQLKGHAKVKAPRVAKALPQSKKDSPTGDMARAVIMQSHGGPEVLELQTIQVPKPYQGEVRIRQTFIGVNYIDVYTRTGYFNLVSPPGIPGMEAVGVIDSVGPDISEFHIGDRVAYACAPAGAYTDLRVMKTDFLVPVPDFISDEMMAASLLKGITASFLLHDVYRLKPDDVVLAHAAAGGVGILLVQWAKALGATVIGTTSSEEKAERIRRAGCDHVINYSREDFANTALEITKGQGVDVVYDAVGRDTFENSLKALKPRGTLVSFGQASGDIGVYEIGKLANKSVTLSRPNYGHYTDNRADVLRHANRFYAAVKSGTIKIDAPRIFALSEAGAAHQAIESRSGTGSIVLRA
jgi:NADPH:quinone reductase-like Zn-dependent oxidoreductase